MKSPTWLWNQAAMCEAPLPCSALMNFDSWSRVSRSLVSVLHIHVLVDTGSRLSTDFVDSRLPSISFPVAQTQDETSFDTLHLRYLSSLVSLSIPLVPRRNSLSLMFLCSYWILIEKLLPVMRLIATSSSEHLFIRLLLRPLLGPYIASRSSNMLYISSSGLLLSSAFSSLPTSHSFIPIRTTIHLGLSHKTSSPPLSLHNPPKPSKTTTLSHD